MLRTNGDCPLFRTWDPAELVFAWLAEPERWEQEAFLPADDEVRELLALPAEAQGERSALPGYVSPRQIAAAAPFRERLAQLAERQRAAGGKPPTLTPLDRKAESLYQAYSQYRQLTFDPERPASRRTRFLEALAAAMQAWNELEEPLLRPPLGDSRAVILGSA